MQRIDMKFFCPITSLTINERVAKPLLVKKMKKHIKLSFVLVIRRLTNVSEVQFPKHDGTDIVSNDYLHSKDSPIIYSLLNRL